MISDNLPALLVVAPLIAAPVCVVFSSGRTAWLLALVASGVSVTISLELASRVYQTGVIHYTMGGWAAPWGIEYRVDALSVLLMMLVTTISTVTLLAARPRLEAEVRTSNLHWYYAVWSLCLAGMLGMAVTGDAFNLFVFLEIASLSSYVLVALSERPGALLAAFRYLVVGTVGATFIVIAIGLFYTITGTLNMDDLTLRLAANGADGTVVLGFVFLFVGIGFKVALFPLHGWLPAAYANAPVVVSAFLAGTATKVGFYMMFRFFYGILGREYSVAGMNLDVLLLGTGLAAALLGSLVAIWQHDLKRMLAFSSIAQVGYIAIAAGLASVTGLTAGIFNLLSHGLAKSALFLVLAGMLSRGLAATSEGFVGLARQMPVTFAVFVIASFSLIGIPGTAGFVSKWYLVSGALEAGLWPVAAWVVGTSLLTMVYVWRLLELAWFSSEAPPVRRPRREAPVGVLVPTAVLGVASLWFGIAPDLPSEFAARAAASLLGVAHE